MKSTGPARCGGANGNGCGARIVFVEMTDTGRKVPVDPIPVDEGNVCARLVGNQLQGYVISKDRPPERPYTRYMTHHATCPDRPRSAPKPKPEPPPTLFDP